MTLDTNYSELEWDRFGSTQGKGLVLVFFFFFNPPADGEK